MKYQRITLQRVDRDHGEKNPRISQLSMKLSIIEVSIGALVAKLMGSM